MENFAGNFLRKQTMETLASVIIPRKNHSPKTLTATKENSITEKINPQNNHMITTEISEVE